MHVSRSNDEDTCLFLITSRSSGAYSDESTNAERPESSEHGNLVDEPSFPHSTRPISTEPPTVFSEHWQRIHGHNGIRLGKSSPLKASLFLAMH